MASVTLTTLRARVRLHADIGASTFVTDAAASLDSFINMGVQALHDKVLNAMGDDALGVTEGAITPTIASGTGVVALPSDFYRLLGVDLLVGGQRIDLKRFNFKERNALRDQTAYGHVAVPRYRLDGANLRFNGPNGAYTGTLFYAPSPALLVNAGDAVNYPNGWEAFAIYHAALLVLAKEESDTREVARLLDIEGARIEAAAARRDSGSPPQMADVEQSSTDSNSPWWF
jgi:hypothetical protein